MKDGQNEGKKEKRIFYKGVKNIEKEKYFITKLTSFPENIIDNFFSIFYTETKFSRIM